MTDPLDRGTRRRLSRILQGIATTAHELHDRLLTGTDSGKADSFTDVLNDIADDVQRAKDIVARDEDL